MPFLSKEADERKIAPVTLIKRIPPCDCGQEFKNRIDRGRGMTLYPASLSGRGSQREFKTAYSCAVCGSKWEQ